jgi:hypothetical protein
MDRPFDQPLRLSNGESVIEIATAQQAGIFLLENIPKKRRRPRSYSDAIAACVRAIGGTAEPEACRQALLAALQDLASNRLSRGGR